MRVVPYDFGARLRELREKKGFSQDYVAKKLEVTRSAISSYESNLKNPLVEHLKAMAFLYNSSVDYMLGLDNRTGLYLDDLTPSQQQTVLDIVARLKIEFNITNREIK